MAELITPEALLLLALLLVCVGVCLAALRGDR